VPVALATAALASGEAQAANCANNVTFSAAPINFGETWDPMISPAAKTLTFGVNISNFANNAQSVRLIFLDNDSGSPLRLGATGPKYTVTDGTTSYAFPAGTSVTNQPPLAITGPQSSLVVTKTFTVTIPANNSPQEDYVGGVQHSEALKFTLQCLKQNGDPTGDVNTLQTGPTINLTVPRLVSLITAGPQTINFGNFTATTEKLQVRLKSTSSVSVAVSTSNGGQMVLKNAASPYPANSVIPYTMTFNDIPLTSGGTLANAGRAGFLMIKEWPLALSLTGGHPSGKVAGDYEDTITLTLTPGS
jgi:hypothetical protein